MGTQMDFSKLQIANWQQFENIDIDFHPRLTIITGSNGSGKTTLLSFLSRHVGFMLTHLTAAKNIPGQGPVYSPLTFKKKERAADDLAVGSLTYTNKVTSRIIAHASNTNPQYSIQLESQHAADVLYIPSHRQVFNYRRIVNIPTTRKERNEVFNEYNGSQSIRYSGHNHGEPSSLIMKNTLISWMINGYGVQKDSKFMMTPDERQKTNFEGFIQILRILLPDTLGFDELAIRDYEIVFVCNGGEDEFLLETASGGISALIDIAWQIYIYDTDNKREFAVVIDEAENHLHPSMQRTLLPKLLAAFPHVKFIVSTHSPLIVTSVESSSVYALMYNEDRKVVSCLLDFHNEVKNAVDTLDQVLGVATTFPEWAEVKLSNILKKHSNFPTPESLADLRSELESAGLGRLFPQAIGVIAETFK